MTTYGYHELRYFVHFLRLFDHRIHSQVDIELIFIENVNYMFNFHIKFVSSKNIDY